MIVRDIFSARWCVLWLTVVSCAGAAESVEPLGLWTAPRIQWIQHAAPPTESFELMPPANPFGPSGLPYPPPEPAWMGPAPAEFPASEPVVAGPVESFDATRPVVVDGGPEPMHPFWEGEDEWESPSRMSWVIGAHDGLGWFGLENQGVLGYWGPEGLAAALGYSILFLEGPALADLPPRLYGLHYGVRWRDQLSERWGYEVAVSPGVYTDFEDSAREGIRVQGHGFVMWTFETLQYVLGIDYLDRDTTKLLPIGGAVWAPNDATRLELVFPRPRLARLVRRQDHFDRWVYVGAEYGGDSWAIERTTGLADVATLNEIRVTLGFETERLSGNSTVLEIGLHTDRELVYRSGSGGFRPADALTLRWGARF